MKNSFKGLSESEALAKIATSGLSEELQQQIFDIAGVEVATTTASTAQTANTATTTGLSTAYKGLAASIGISTAALTAFIGVAAGIAVAFAILDYTQHAFTRATEAADEAASSYSEAKDSLSSLESEYESVKSQIEELQELQTNGSITMAQEIELQNLRDQNSELERQISLQQQLVDIRGKASAEAAKKASEAEQSFVEESEEKYGSFWGKIIGYLGAPRDYITVENGEIQYKSALQEYLGDRTVEGQIESNIQKLDEYQDKLSEVEEQLTQDPDNKFLKSQAETLSDQIQSINTELASQIEMVQGWIDQSVDSDGVAYKGYEKVVENWRSILNDFNNIGKSRKEIDLNNLTNFFSSTNGSSIEKFLKNVIKNGGSAKDALKEFKRLGLDLDDLDISPSGFLRYFEDIEKAAQETYEVVDKVNNNLTISDVGEAFESANAGDDYVNLNDYLKQAKELFDEGLIGTDDFKSVAEAISYGIDSSAEAFEKNYEKLQRYFKEDDDGNLTSEGIVNFLNDLEDLGKGYATWNEEAGKWDINMDNTAQAAKEMGISVQSMEAILGRIKDYDNIGDFDFTSAIDEFNTAKDALTGIEETLDNMSDGDRKKKLSEQVEVWREQLEACEDDLALLDTDIVMNLRLEYDLATIQAQIDKTRNLIEAGADSSENHATVIAGNSTYIDTAETGLGLKNEGIEIPVQYTVIEDSITALKDQINKATSEEEKVKIQAEVENLQEIQKNLLDAFSDVHPEINSDSSIKEINSAWSDFVDSVEGQKIIADFTANSDDAKKVIAEILGIDPEDIVITIDADDQASSVIDDINKRELISKTCTLYSEDHATGLINLWNTLSANPKFTSLSAEDQATVVIEYWNSLTPEEKTAIMNSEMTASDEGASSVINGVDSLIDSMNLSPTANLKANDHASGTISSVKTNLESLNGKTVNTYIITHQQTVSSGAISGSAKTVGASRINGTAHKDGTLSGNAYLEGNLEDTSWIKQRWKTKKNNVALTGEEAPEIVVYGNKWWTVGDKGTEFANIPKGAVVFNAQQTKELLEKGHLDSRGNAYLSGTAYLGSSNGGFSFGGGLTSSSAKKSSSSKSSSSSNSSSKSKSKSSSSSTSSASEEAEEFEETLDWIITLIDRIERKISSLDLTASSVYKNWTTRTSALKSEAHEVLNEISTQEKAYKRYLQEAESVGLDSSWAKLVREGKVDIETITDEDLSEKISQYQEWYEKALDCKDAIKELNETLSDLYSTAFDNILTRYDGILSDIEFQKNLLEEQISQTEESGYITSTKYYEALMKVEKSNIAQLQKEKSTLEASLNEAVKRGAIQKNSEEWSNMCQEINEVTLAIEEANTAMIDYGNSIRDIEWEVFDLLQGKISLITSEVDFLVDLLINDELYGDRGQLTNEGMATMGLHGLDYNTYMAQADEYAKEILNIDKQLAKDPYNQDLVDRREELLELQQEMILAAEDSKQAIKEMVEDGIELELDALNDLIEKYKETIDNAKDLYDYQKKISEYTDEIASLEKQLKAYSGDLSEEGRLKVQQITVDLKEARENLEESQYDQWLSDQEKLLDELYDQYELILNERLDNVDALIADMISEINNNASTISTTLSEKAESVGYTLSDNMTSIWDTNSTKITDVLTMYGTNFTSALTTTNSTLNTINTNLQSMITQLNKIAGTNVSSASTASATKSKAASGTAGTTTSTKTTTTTSTKTSTSSSSSNSGWGSWFVKKKSYYPKSKLNKEVSIVDRLAYFDYDNSFSIRSKYFSAMGGTGKYTGSAKQNTWMIAQMKSHGFAKGGTIGDIINKTGEDGFILARSGEEILSLEKIQALGDAFAHINPVIDNLNNLLTVLPPSTSNTNTSTSNHIDKINFEITLPNVTNYDEFRKSLESDRNFNKWFDAKMGTLAPGKSSYSVHRYIK